MSGIKAPESRKSTSLTVAVKCRGLTDNERCRNIVKVVDNKDIYILDPDWSKDYLERLQNRSKEKNYSFDHAFGPECKNLGVYKRCISSTISGVVQGLNATVFAYGSTGSGKTYTMVGTKDDPGLMVLSLHTIFDLIKVDKSPDQIEVTCSYLEVYNEVIYDLLEKSSGHLELREDPVQGIIVAGLRCIKVRSADKILELLNMGNSRRKTESTEANAASSRSHAVLEITVKRKETNQVTRGKLALVDLAGSERASETNSGGQKLRDGSNINRSLLALANCINALGKQHKKGFAYVPYRNSKLTRILKDGLSGNSQTVMVATISPASNQYHHTVNTLKYADRAKEIKTHIQKNIGTIDTHVSDYQQMIDNLQTEVGRLKKELAEKESQLSVKPAEKAADDELSWLNVLSHEISENVQERINLQKALFELEEINLLNRAELQHLDEAIAKHQANENDCSVLEALAARRQEILDNIRDNDEAGVNYQKEIEGNEKQRCQLQEMIDDAIANNGNKTYLRILSQYRLLGMANSELQFEMAMRDHVIYSQRETLRNMWSVLTNLGVDEKQILDLAAKRRVKMQDFTVGPNFRLSDMKQSLNLGFANHIKHHGLLGQSYKESSCIFSNYQRFCLGSLSNRQWGMANSLIKEEHHSSYSILRHDNSPSGCLSLRRKSDHWAFNRPASWFETDDKLLSDLHSSQTTHSSPCSERSTFLSSDFGQQNKVVLEQETHPSEVAIHKKGWENNYVTAPNDKSKVSPILKVSNAGQRSCSPLDDGKRMNVQEQYDKMLQLCDVFLEQWKCFRPNYSDCKKERQPTFKNGSQSVFMKEDAGQILQELQENNKDSLVKDKGRPESVQVSNDYSVAYPNNEESKDTKRMVEFSRDGGNHLTTVYKEIFSNTNGRKRGKLTDTIKSFDNKGSQNQMIPAESPLV